MQDYFLRFYENAAYKQLLSKFKMRYQCELIFFFFFCETYSVAIYEIIKILQKDFCIYSLN